MRLFVCALLLTPALLAGQVTYEGDGGTAYYVSSAGDDHHDGVSPNAPFRTLKAASGCLRPGDSLLLKRGSAFHEPLYPVSGVEGAWIRVFQGRSYNHPELSY